MAEAGATYTSMRTSTSTAPKRTRSSTDSDDPISLKTISKGHRDQAEDTVATARLSA